jgi:hypothetical protein
LLNQRGVHGERELEPWRKNGSGEWWRRIIEKEEKDRKV